MRWRPLSLEIVIRVRLLFGRKYLMDKLPTSRFKLSANSDLNSSNVMLRLTGIACASPPLYDDDPSLFGTNSPPNWQIATGFPMGMILLAPAITYDNQQRNALSVMSQEASSLWRQNYVFKYTKILPEMLLQISYKIRKRCKHKVFSRFEFCFLHKY